MTPKRARWSFISICRQGLKAYVWGCSKTGSWGEYLGRREIKMRSEKKMYNEKLHNVHVTPKRARWSFASICRQGLKAYVWGYLKTGSWGKYLGPRGIKMVSEKKLHNEKIHNVHVVSRCARWSFTSICRQVEVMPTGGWQALTLNGLQSLNIADEVVFKLKVKRPEDGNILRSF